MIYIFFYELFVSVENGIRKSELQIFRFFISELNIALNQIKFIVT